MFEIREDRVINKTAIWVIFIYYQAGIHFRCLEIIKVKPIVEQSILGMGDMC